MMAERDVSWAAVARVLGGLLLAICAWYLRSNNEKLDRALVEIAAMKSQQSAQNILNNQFITRDEVRLLVSEESRLRAEDSLRRINRATKLIPEANP